MNIFDDIGKDIPEFKNYLYYLFEMKQSRTVATRQVVFLFYEFTAELFYPKCVENQERTQVATTLSSEADTMIMMELIDTRKFTSKHFSCIQGQYSMLEATEHMKQYGIGKKAINGVLDRSFSVFKESIENSGTLDLIVPQQNHRLVSTSITIEVIRIS